MDMSRREFIRQVGVGKSARFLGGLLGMGIFGSFGIVEEGSADEAARDLARHLAKKSKRVASPPESGTAGSGSVPET